MFDSTKELLDKIRLGEDSFLELKEVRFAGERVSALHRDSVADELAAFANARGGVLVLGVDDKTRDIIGIPDERLDVVERFLFEVCAQLVDPPLAPAIEWLWLPSTTGEESAVLKVAVPRSLFVHGSPGGYLHRVGSSKRRMPSDYLARLFSTPRSTGTPEQLLAKLAMVAHIMDKRGEGVPIILARSEQLSGKIPGIPPDRRIRAHADNPRGGFLRGSA